MENRIQKLGQVLEKNSTWRWLGYGTLLGDGDSNQYAGLKVFMKYVLENRTSLIDQREDKGVNFTSTGNNTICRKFIKYLQTEGEEKKDAQLLLMANRAEGMMQMKDPSLGKMNDGIFLAHAFAFIGLGENANPRIEVTQDSIVGLLEKGLIESRKQKPELGNVIDFAEGKTKKLDVPKPTEGSGAAPSGAVSKKAPGKASGALSGGGGSAGGAVSYTHAASGTTVTTTKEENAPEEAPKQPEKAGVVESVKGKKATTAGGADVGVKGKEGADDGMEEALILQAAASGGGPASGKIVRKGGEKRVEGGQGRGEGKVNIPEGSKLQRAVVTTGKGKRKKVSSKKRRIKQAKDEALRERERQRVPQQQAPQPAQGQAGQRPPVPSGGWKYAKRAGKIAVGGGTGAGIIGWASASGSEAVASTFSSTLAFIHTLF